MPALPNPRHEAFAQARARGARLEDAYEDAGFAPGNRHAARLFNQDKIAERIAELRVERLDSSGADPAEVIEALLRMAKTLEDLKTPASLKEAKDHLLEAYRLRCATHDERSQDRSRRFFE